MQQFPAYMCVGSRGPAVNLILVFLCGWSHGNGKDIKCNGTYDEVARRWMRRFQADNVLGPTGVLDPFTMTCLKEKGFNFEEAAIAVGGKTIFVQPDGSKIVWSPPRTPRVRGRHADTRATAVA